MANRKTSMSARIRNLLDKGLEPQKIAKRLGVSPSYVHTIKWSYTHNGNGNGNSNDSYASNDNGGSGSRTNLTGSGRGRTLTGRGSRTNLTDSGTGKERTTFRIAERDDGTQVVIDNTATASPRSDDNLEQFVRDQVSAMIVAKVQNILQGIR